MLLPVAQFAALVDDQQAVTAAACLIEQYRRPPGHKESRRTRWQRQASLFPTEGSGKPSTRTSFLEKDARGLQCAGKAVLWVSQERKPFTLTLRRRIAEATQGVDLVFVLHLGGRVEPDVTNLNVARTIPRRGGGRDGGDVEEENRMEVHSSREIPLYEPLFPTYSVPHACAFQVLALYGNGDDGLPVLEDVGALPLVHPLYPEVLFTGAREGDLVEVVEPTGFSHYLVAPLESAEPPRRKLLQNLRRAKEEWRVQADLCFAIRAVASEHCLWLVREEARLSDLLSSLPEEARTLPTQELEGLEDWSTGEAAERARVGSEPARQEHFASLAAVSPRLHAKIAELLESVPKTLVWACSLVINGICVALWTSTSKNAIAVGRLLHNNPGKAQGGEDSAFPGEDGALEDCAAASGGRNNHHAAGRRLVGDSDQDSAGGGSSSASACGAEDDDEEEESGGEESLEASSKIPSSKRRCSGSGAGSSVLESVVVVAHHRRSGAAPPPEEEEAPPWRVFRDRLHARLLSQGGGGFHQNSPQAVQALRAKLPAWENCARDAATGDQEDRVGFWQSLSCTQGLPLEVSMAALALSPEGASLVEEVYGLGSMLKAAAEAAAHEEGEEVGRWEQ